MAMNVNENFANARNGAYTFKAPGSIYHQIGPFYLLQEADQGFYRFIYMRQVLRKIKHVLDQYNPYVLIFRHSSHHQDKHWQGYYREQP